MSGQRSHATAKPSLRPRAAENGGVRREFVDEDALGAREVWRAVRRPRVDVHDPLAGPPDGGQARC